MLKGLSYVHGASDVPLIGETVGAHFDRAVASSVFVTPVAGAVGFFAFLGLASLYLL